MPVILTCGTNLPQMIFFIKYLEKAYLGALPARLARGKLSWLDHLFKYSTSASNGRRTLAHWMSTEPYLSTKRTFAKIDYVLGINTENKKELAIRGWLFDLESKVTRLVMQIEEKSTSQCTLVYPETRPDVSEAFVGQRNARGSGFLALFNAPVSPSNKLIAKFTYNTEEGLSVTFTLPLPETIYSVPGVSAPLPIKHETLNPSKIVIVADPNIPGWRTTIASVLSSSHHIEPHPNIITLPANDQEYIEDFESEGQLLAPVSVSSLQEGIEVLGTCVHTAKLVLAILSPSDQAVAQVTSNVVLTPQIPDILWILSDEREYSPPEYCRGGLVSWMRLQDREFNRKLKTRIAGISN